MEQEIKEEGLLKRTWMEISQPFKDLFHTSQALFGLNLSYLLEGLTYFGVLTYLTLYFNEYAGLNDINAGQMVGILTAGITLSMLFFGATVDWIGLRKSLILALLLMLVGRILLSFAPSMGGSGFGGSIHIVAMIGIFGIILGYGIYQPAAYAGVKKLTTEKTAAMGYAMLYALMNLGSFLPGVIAPGLRKSYSMIAVMWVYVIFTVIGIAVVYFIITKKAYKKALQQISTDKGETEPVKDEENGFKVFVETCKNMYAKKKTIANSLASFTLFFFIVTLCKETRIIDFGFLTNSNNMILHGLGSFNWFYILFLIAIIFLVFIITDSRFVYFVFILIPVQTLFAHNWLTLPAYFKRAFEGAVSEYFEFFSNFNPVLIFILTPIVTALTSKKSTYKMMIIGTFVMASPTFFLATGPTLPAVFAYLIIMSIGEAMWQPRFLQWVAEIAPKNMTGIYMGIGQFPWFMTKIVTSLYSGWFLMNYCPDNALPAQMNTGKMWLIYGFIAMVSPLGLLLARNWMIKGFKVKHQ